MNVEEVSVGELDPTGVTIECVYVKNAPDYAIYRTAQRVMVHFADSQERKQQQQEVLAALNPLRGEINGLIDGWRESTTHDKEAMTRLFDRRIADSLAMALENDVTTARVLLRSTLEEITEERQSRGRIEHLLYAGITASGLGLIAFVISRVRDGFGDNFFQDHVNLLLFAAGIGGFGALVSIAIAVRERSLATDLQSRDNIADAVLRVCVGAIGAILLIAMFRSDLIDVGIGKVDLGGSDQNLLSNSAAANANSAAPAQSAPANGSAATANAAAGPAPAPAVGGGNVQSTAAPQGNAIAQAPTDSTSSTNSANSTSPTNGSGTTGSEKEPDGPRVPNDSTDFLVLLVIAFFAGFTERLVKQLGDRIRFRDAIAMPVVAALPGANAPPPPARPGAPPAGGPGSGADLAPPDDDTEGADGCIAEIDIAEEDSTDDTQLPAAAGGVEELAGDDELPPHAA